MTRPHWDFEYRLVAARYEPLSADAELVVATRRASAVSDIAAALRRHGALQVVPLVERAPIFWYGVHAEGPLDFADVQRALEDAGVAVRYVASAVQGDLSLGERLSMDGARAATATSWAARPPRVHPEPTAEGRWVFDEQGGIAVDRDVCGTGAGTRVAVIDDESIEPDALGLDEEVLVGTHVSPRISHHGSMMIAWAVGLRGDEGRGIAPFAGIAPDASPRLYVIPKPGRELTSLPRAIIRAVDDGADVVLCATNVDAATSPMLDDALTFANRLGRGGRGSAVVIPTGREISSPPGSLHASLTLPLGDPASDPRVICVAPSGREGGWFLWKDRRERLRPFANRGPSVRIAAPGDDMAYPLSKQARMGHAESSGASAIAAGALLLVLGVDPELTVDELYDLVTATASHDASAVAGTPADAADLLPAGTDRDGHDAKCGYGRLLATRACLWATDPVAAALSAIGEDRAARSYLVRRGGGAQSPYTGELARWAARAVRRDPGLLHELKALVRHFRLLALYAERRRFQPPEAVARSLALFVERLHRSHDVPQAVRTELTRLERDAIDCTRDRTRATALCAACEDAATKVFRESIRLDGEEAVQAVGAMARSA
ncbi:MAG TPA: S8 family serine peptidase [Polyangiaceae bacterium]|nr:S8 family serine peptidase [Polyangiaceae bacterium]